MDWIRLMKAIGLFLMVIGGTAAIALLITINPNIGLAIIFVAAAIVSIIAIYTLLGKE